MDYQEEILPAEVKARLAVEAGSTLGWDRYTGPQGRCMGIERFGASAPGKVLFEEYGFTVENVIEKAKILLNG
jgi:transketolase